MNRWRETWQVHRNLNRANKTTTDRERSQRSRIWPSRTWRISSTSTGCAGFPDPQGRGRGSGRTNRGGLRGRPGGQPPAPARPRQVRHVRGTASAAGAHSQGRLARRDPPTGNSDPSFILHLFATALGIDGTRSCPKMSPISLKRPIAWTMCDGLVFASYRRSPA